MKRTNATELPLLTNRAEHGSMSGCARFGLAALGHADYHFAMRMLRHAEQTIAAPARF